MLGLMLQVQWRSNDDFLRPISDHFYIVKINKIDKNAMHQFGTQVLQ